MDPFLIGAGCALSFALFGALLVRPGGRKIFFGLALTSYFPFLGAMAFVREWWIHREGPLHPPEYEILPLPIGAILLVVALAGTALICAWSPLRLAAPLLVGLGFLGFMRGLSSLVVLLFVGMLLLPIHVASATRREEKIAVVSVLVVLTLVTAPVSLLATDWTGGPDHGTWTAVITPEDERRFTLTLPFPTSLTLGAENVHDEWMKSLELRGNATFSLEEGLVLIEGSGEVSLFASSTLYGLGGRAAVNEFSIGSEPAMLEAGSPAVVLRWGLHWGVCNVEGSLSEVRLLPGEPQPLSEAGKIPGVYPPICHAD